MAQLSDDDWKEIYVADLYYGMIERGVYEPRKLDTINDVLNRLHVENNRND